MRYLTIYIRSIILLIPLFLTLSCSKDFIEYRNPQTLALFGTIKDLSSLTNAANGVYDKFQGGNYYGRTFILVPDLIGDNVFISVSNTGKYLSHDNFAVTNGDSYVTGAWASMWQVIVNANLAIANGESINFKVDEQVAAKQIIGEMYIARALAYFDMVRFFAQPYNFTPDASHMGVPIVTEPKKEIISPARSSVKEVYAQIIADLNSALPLMVPGKANGKFTYWTAKALLAKAYLYMEDWVNAEKYASEVIAGPYALLTNSAYVGSWALNYSSESLFEVVNSASDRVGVEGIGYFFDQGGSYGEGLATADLYNTYTATDVRRQLIAVGIRKVNFEKPAYFIKKYPRGLATMDDNIKVLRLSEVYLIRAEALAEMSKTDASKTAGAQADVNLIAKRADAAAVAISSTGQDLVDRIILERRKELAFEGNRLFDLTRKKKAVIHIQSDQTRTFTYPNNRFIMPIPYAERNANKNIAQNPGWN